MCHSKWDLAISKSGLSHNAQVPPKLKSAKCKVVVVVLAAKMQQVTNVAWSVTDASAVMAVKCTGRSKEEKSDSSLMRMRQLS